MFHCISTLRTNTLLRLSHSLRIRHLAKSVFRNAQGTREWSKLKYMALHTRQRYKNGTTRYSIPYTARWLPTRKTNSESWSLFHHFLTSKSYFTMSSSIAIFRAEAVVSIDTWYSGLSVVRNLGNYQHVQKRVLTDCLTWKAVLVRRHSEGGVLFCLNDLDAAHAHLQRYSRNELPPTLLGRYSISPPAVLVD